MRSTLQLMAKASKGKHQSGPSNHSESIDLVRKALYGNKKVKSLKMNPDMWEKHEVINRAWRIHEYRQEKQRENLLKNQFSAMKIACEELKHTSETLYKAAMSDSINRRFPVETRTPTDTPPRLSK